MRIVDSKGAALRRVAGFRGGQIEADPDRDVMSGIQSERIRAPENHVRPGGGEWEPICRRQTRKEWK